MASVWCGPLHAQSPQSAPLPPNASGVVPSATPTTMSFAAFVQSLWPEAQRAGVSRATFETAIAGLSPDLSLPDLLAGPSATAAPRRSAGQAEFTRPPRSYLDSRQLGGLALEGRALAKTHAAALAQIERTTGVEPAIVLAIWGRETAFGRWKASHDVLRSLATLAWRGRRADLFQREFIFALRMLEARMVTRADMRGSWAGAMGLTQFMPSEFFGTAIALDPQRAPDLFRSIDDALASAANQLKLKGWKSGEPWGLEVRLPPSVSCAREGVNGRRPLRTWLAEGVTLARPGPVPERLLDLPVFLLAPAGTQGPVFLAFENFLVLKAYNFADLYALFVGNLADRIAGRPDFATPWADVSMLSTADLERVQTLLKDAGESIEKIDGKAGMNTRSSIGRYQARVGLPVDCWPSRRLLDSFATKR